MKGGGGEEGRGEGRRDKGKVRSIIKKDLLLI